MTHILSKNTEMTSRDHSTACSQSSDSDVYHVLLPHFCKCLFHSIKGEWCGGNPILSQWHVMLLDMQGRSFPFSCSEKSHIHIVWFISQPKRKHISVWGIPFLEDDICIKHLKPWKVIWLLFREKQKRKMKQDQIGLERSARWSCSVFCVLCTVGEVAWA